MDDIDYMVTTWGVDRPALQQVRRQVFIVEQEVPEEEEWDDEDPVAVHVLATRNREPVGTGRLSPRGKIGRLAVTADMRQKGIGKRIMQLLIQEAYHRGMLELHLNAQVQAIRFYEQCGFAAEGGIFMEAGIPHRRMRRTLVAA